MDKDIFIDGDFNLSYGYKTSAEYDKRKKQLREAWIRNVIRCLNYSPQMANEIYDRIRIANMKERLKNLGLHVPSTD